MTLSVRLTKLAPNWDADGARSILEEVMEEGDAAQKKQAEELLTQIA